MVIFATLFRRCPTLWKSTLKMTTLFRRCLTFKGLWRKGIWGKLGHLRGYEENWSQHFTNGLHWRRFRSQFLLPMIFCPIFANVSEFLCDKVWIARQISLWQSLYELLKQQVRDYLYLIIVLTYSYLFIKYLSLFSGGTISEKDENSNCQFASAVKFQVWENSW